MIYIINKMGCCSNYMVNLIKNSNPEDALKDTFIIKQITLGISNLESKIAKIAKKEEAVHTAFFISNLGNESFGDEGIILEYGKYESKNNGNGLMKYEYDDGGMRYGWCKLTDFQNSLATAVCINLDLEPPLIIFRDLIERLKEKKENNKYNQNNRNWDLKDFSTIYHNCQHFAAKVIEILKAKCNDKYIEIRNNELLKNGKKIDIIPKIIREALLNNNNN